MTKAFVGVFRTAPEIVAEVPGELTQFEQNKLIFDKLVNCYRHIANIDDHPAFMLYITEDGNPGFTSFTEEYRLDLRKHLELRIATDAAAVGEAVVDDLDDQWQL
jgi:hypothetical protein